MLGNDNRRPKAIWAWDKNTMILCGEYEALPNPYDHKRWMLPAFATFVKPSKARVGYDITWNEKKQKWANVKTA